MNQNTSPEIQSAIRELATIQLIGEIKALIEREHAVKMALVQPDQRIAPPEAPEPDEEQINTRAARIHDDPTPGELHLVWAAATHRGVLPHTSMSWGEWGNQWFTLGVLRHTS